MNGNTANAVGTGLAASLNPGSIKNPKRVSITKLDSGFLIEKQNVETYGAVNDVAVDLDGAVKVANEYFAE